MTQHTKLFTPGPLNTSTKVKEAMSIDIGSRTPTLIDLTQKLRETLEEVAECDDDFTSILLQGSGTFATEAMLTSLITNDDLVLVVSNGVYGERLVKICQIHAIKHVVLRQDSGKSIQLDDIKNELKKNGEITHIAVVHFETALGVLNDVNGLLGLAVKYQCEVLVDAMSSFGVLSLDYQCPSLMAVASSANKCLHGVPGVSFVLVRLEQLYQISLPKTLCLDLKAQWNEFTESGQWRYTPPTHVLLAFYEALVEFKEAGGRAARFKKYAELTNHLIAGLARLDIHPAISAEYRAPMITTFLIEKQNIRFNFLYEQLSLRGLIIYPSSYIKEKSFRVGCMGEITISDIDELVESISQVIKLHLI